MTDEERLQDREEEIQRALDGIEEEVIALATLLLIRNLAEQILPHVSAEQQPWFQTGLAEALRVSGIALGSEHREAAELLRQLLDVQMQLARGSR